MLRGSRQKMAKDDISDLGGFVWSIAEILRGDFKQSEYGKVILPFVVLRALIASLKARKMPYSAQTIACRTAWTKPPAI